jgi:BMFP domain-containing protein YqiC
MQTENKFFDDLTRMMSGAMSAAGGVREEAEARLRQHFEAMFARMDLVRREEFNVVRDMAALARQENERLSARIAELEKGGATKKAAPKKATAKKSPAKKAAAKKSAPKKAAPKAEAASGGDTAGGQD